MKGQIYLKNVIFITDKTNFKNYLAVLSKLSYILCILFRINYLCRIMYVM